MGRLFYVCLLSLHPRPFRERFGEEMIDIFDEGAGSRRRVALFVDAFISLFRQWVLRPSPANRCFPPPLRGNRRMRPYFTCSKAPCRAGVRSSTELSYRSLSLLQ